MPLFSQYKQLRTRFITYFAPDTYKAAVNKMLPMQLRNSRILAEGLGNLITDFIHYEAIDLRREEFIRSYTKLFDLTAIAATTTCLLYNFYTFAVPSTVIILIPVIASNILQSIEIIRLGHILIVPLVYSLVLSGSIVHTALPHVIECAALLKNTNTVILISAFAAIVSLSFQSNANTLQVRLAAAIVSADAFINANKIWSNIITLTASVILLCFGYTLLAQGVNKLMIDHDVIEGTKLLIGAIIIVFAVMPHTVKHGIDIAAHGLDAQNLTSTQGLSINTFIAGSLLAYLSIGFTVIKAHTDLIFPYAEDSETTASFLIIAYDITPTMDKHHAKASVLLKKAGLLGLS